MQFDRMSFLLSLRTNKKKSFYSNYSFIFFIVLSISLIFLDVNNLIKSSIVRSKIVNISFVTKDLFLFYLPNTNKIKAIFSFKKELILENKTLKNKLEKSDLFKLKSEKLEIENNILKKELSLLPSALDKYVFVKVLADTQTPYTKTVIINAGNNMLIQKGDAAITAKGLIGSVIEVYDKYSRLLLITDINSKVPVRIGNDNLKAIIGGNNTDKIDLLYLKDNVRVKEEDLVYTSGDGGYFNSGVPIGIIKKEENKIYVEPFNDLDQMQYLNIYINQFKNF